MTVLIVPKLSWLALIAAPNRRQPGQRVPNRPHLIAVSTHDVGTDLSKWAEAFNGTIGRRG